MIWIFYIIKSNRKRQFFLSLAIWELSCCSFLSNWSRSYLLLWSKCIDVLRKVDWLIGGCLFIFDWFSSTLVVFFRTLLFFFFCLFFSSCVFRVFRNPVSFSFFRLVSFISSTLDFSLIFYLIFHFSLYLCIFAYLFLFV